jgi:ribonuclease P/MRP protein subunit RPP20
LPVLILTFVPRYKEIYLTAMGAAIPHLMMLATSLPAILPYDRREIKTTVTTGTVSVTDEVIPQDEDDEGETRTRRKASLEIIIRVAPKEGMDIDTTAGPVGDSDSFSD